jgi:integrase
VPKKSDYPKKLANGRWWIRWREGGHHRQATFDTKREAETYLATVTVSRARGEVFDPTRGRITLDAFWPQFLAGFEDPPRPTTLDGYRRLRELYIGGSSSSPKAMPAAAKLGRLPLNAITPERVAGWRGALRSHGVGESTVFHATQLLRTMLNRAVAFELIPKSPAKAIRNRAPKATAARALEPDEVRALAEAIDERFRALVFLLAFRGLRIGEAAALRTGDLDLMRGELRIDETLVEIGGEIHVGPPKTDEGNRTVSLPPFLRDMLTEHLARFSDPAEPEAFVFTMPEGGALRPGNFRQRFFDPAVRAAGLTWRPTPHNLRDTAATLALIAGGDVMEVARMLGHTDPAITLRRYASVLESRRSRTDERLDALYRAAEAEVPKTATVSEIGGGA